MTSQARKQQETGSTQNNPWGEKNPFSGFSSMPQFDMNAARNHFSDMMRDMSNANEVLMNCARETARRNMELAQRNAQCFYDCSRDVTSSRSSDDAKVKGYDMMSSIGQNCFDHTRENAEIAAKAAVELVDLCSKRFSEMLREMQKAAK